MCSLRGGPASVASWASAQGTHLSSFNLKVFFSTRENVFSATYRLLLPNRVDQRVLFSAIDKT